jgi:hypothetical protein
LTQAGEKPDILVTLMPPLDPKSKLGELVTPAQSSLEEFLRLDEFANEQWFMRLAVRGKARGWELLTAETSANDRMIKERIELSEKPVTELVVAFAGMIEWRGSKRLMAYLQYFQSEYEQGLLCLRHLKDAPQPGKVEGFGGFMVVSGCKNIWI